MGFVWSKEQQQVIDLRNRNILVSAAAGSGKTAVLVERIIQKITDEEHPVDIDKLLIVTFTNAAAAEMRERISLAIEKKLTEHPESVNLQRQLTLVHNAQITTIDSFCLYVIRNYFHKIDLEPGFRVADEGEMALLKSDMLDEVLESFYEEGTAEFQYFADNYTSAKNDQAIRDMVLQMYQFSQSYPWPMEWLDSVVNSYEMEDLTQMEATPWMKLLVEYLKSMSSGFLEEMNQCLILTGEEDGPQMYQAAVQSDVDQLAVLAHSDSFGQFEQNLKNMNFARLGSSRKYEGSVEKQDYVKNKRNEIKKAVADVTSQFFFLPAEQMVECMKKTAPYMQVLSDMTKQFAHRLAEKKREKNMIDFNDMEHFALTVLVDEETKRPTETAEEFQRNFEEIMIDEYQDSNYVQETILTAISKEPQGEHNIFMVGDVKQSIYRFRLARPELFMEKYDTYSMADGPQQRIDLHQNYRSRQEVVDTVNDVFYSIMDKDLGNVVYDDLAALYQGAQFTEPEMPQAFQTECLILNKEVEDSEEPKNLTKQELEARMVAARIQELMEQQTVTDKETGELRPIRYSDIVILFRSLSNWADTFVEVLMKSGIPAHTESKTGYFSTLEIQTLLDLLRVVDNPLQDIPLTAVLKSYFGGLSGEELAKIKAAFPQEKFYQAVFQYGKTDQKWDAKIVTKLEHFFEMADKYRKMAAYTPIHELIVAMMTETGYGQYVSALPTGAKKMANLQMLVEKAIAYESTSYRGLFHFVCYIEKLQKYDVDFGEAELNGDSENTVRIMSIHKSKGLEFPVVFVSGMGKQFNKQDTRSRLILHPELGAGLDYVDGERRLKTPTLIKRVLARQTEMENLGEELRVLYVALTRAKEKLILTGSMANPEDKIETYQYQTDIAGSSKMSFLQRTKSSSYLEWTLPVLCRNRVRYHIQCVNLEEIRQRELTDAIEKSIDREQFFARITAVNPAVYEQVEHRLSFQYPYREEAGIKSKISVSELKHKAMQFEQEEENPEQWFGEAEPEVDELIPDFMKEKVEVNLGALRGSAVHRAMECLDFVAVYEGVEEEHRAQIFQRQESQKVVFTAEEKKEIQKQIKKQLKARLDDGKIPQDMYDLIYAATIAEFFESSLAMRMSAAEMRGTLKREKPFVMGIPAHEVDEQYQSEELVLIQGIIDGFFIENGNVVVMDYKTDRVSEAEELVGRYQAQLDLYARALSKITESGEEQIEKIIYSFRLKKEIHL